MFSGEDVALGDANVDSSTALAELSVAQLYILPQTIQSTDAVTFGVDVRNDGGAESGAFVVRFTLDNSETREVEFPSIAPGASHWQEWQHEPLDAGTHMLSVQLDVQDQVREGNKYDNSVSLAFQINGALPLDNLIADDAAAIEMDAEVIVASADSEKKKGKRADPEEAPKCQAAAHDLEVLHDYLNWLAREIGKPTPDPKKLDDLRKLVQSQAQGIIDSLDNYIAAGCCEPSLKTLEAEVNGLPWSVDPSAELEHARLVQAIRQAQEKARTDYEHC